MTETPLDVALACAARGWHVFPCKPDKTPWTRHGFKDATTDEGRIRWFWEQRPDAAIGIATGASGLVAADIDVKGAENGEDAWHELVAECGAELEQTTIVETPSGGFHVYYRANGHRIGSNASKLAPGIDVRAEGGYVIAAGSPGYLYVDGHGPETLASLPAVLGRRLAYAAPTSPLIPESALGIPAGRRDSTLTSLAGAMRRKGVSQETILLALRSENNEHCKPPLPEADIERIARSVARYEPAEVPQAANITSGGLYVDWSTFWDGVDEQEWVWGEVLAKGRGHAIYAMHKGGKSLITLYMAAQIATNGSCAVIYLDYEMGESDVRERLTDMGYGPESDFSHLHYALLPTLPALDTVEGGEALAALVDEVTASEPERHVVVVIDTISRAVWGEENSADTWRLFYVHTGLRLKQRGVTWVRLDHGGKDAARGQRGSSGKGDDVDVVWKLKPSDGGVTLHRELSRMSWVPEVVAFTIEDGPLVYVPAGDVYPPDTGALANIMDRASVPMEATVKEAKAALQKIHEGRRTDLVAKALKWRREKLAERVSGHFPEGGERGGERVFELPLGTNGEDAGNEDESSLGNAAGNAGEQGIGVGGERRTPIYRGTPSHSTRRPAKDEVEMGDM